MMFCLASAFAQQLNQDSTSIVPNGTMATPMNNKNTYSAVNKTIQLPYRPIYQCPNYGPGSLGGGSWGYYGCHGQISFESSCMTIEYPKYFTMACFQIS